MIISIIAEKFSVVYYVFMIKTKNKLEITNFSDKVITQNLTTNIIDKHSEILKLFISQEEGMVITSLLTYTFIFMV